MSSECKELLLEKSLYRLLLIGGIKGYEKGPESFRVSLIISEESYIYKNCRNYIKRYEIEELVYPFVPKGIASSYKDAVLQCGYSLIDYSYRRIKTKKAHDKAKMFLAVEDGQETFGKFRDYLHESMEPRVIEARLAILATEFWWRVLEDIKGVDDLLGLFLACQKMLRRQPKDPIIHIISGFSALAFFDIGQEDCELVKGFRILKNSSKATYRVDVARQIISYGELLIPSKKDLILKRIWQADPSLEISRLCYERAGFSSEISYLSLFKLVDELLKVFKAEVPAVNEEGRRLEILKAEATIRELAGRMVEASESTKQADNARRALEAAAGSIEALSILFHASIESATGKLDEDRKSINQARDSLDICAKDLQKAQEILVTKAENLETSLGKKNEEFYKMLDARIGSLSQDLNIAQENLSEKAAYLETSIVEASQETHELLNVKLGSLSQDLNIAQEICSEKAAYLETSIVEASQETHELLNVKLGNLSQDLNSAQEHLSEKADHLETSVLVASQETHELLNVKLGNLSQDLNSAQEHLSEKADHLETSVLVASQETHELLDVKLGNLSQDLNSAQEHLSEKADHLEASVVVASQETHELLDIKLGSLSQDLNSAQEHLSEKADHLEASVVVASQETHELLDVKLGSLSQDLNTISNKLLFVMDQNEALNRRILAMQQLIEDLSCEFQGFGNL